MRERRRQTIATLIARVPVASQEHLSRLLAKEGIAANQATLSRDLRDMGVLKGPTGYLLPGSGTIHAAPGVEDATDRLASAKTFVVWVGAAGNLVVLRTRPGNASPLATELDRLGLPGVLGTVAGDDTVFVAAASSREAMRLARSIGTRTNSRAQGWSSTQ